MRDAVSSIALFVVSTVCMTGIFVVALGARFSSKVGHSGDQFVDGQWESERTKRKSKLVWPLVVVVPIFPILYLLLYFYVIDRDQL